MSRASAARLLACLLPLVAGAGPPASAQGEAGAVEPDAKETGAGVRAFKIRVLSPAVYRVGWEDLRAAGLEGEAESSALALTHRGGPVPIWVEDGGDGRLGAGDWVEFVGEALRGEHSWFDEYSPENVYRLSLGGGEPLRMGSRGAEPPAAGEVGAPARYRVRRHLEEDRLMLRFAPRGESQQELWYWAKVSHRDSQPLRVPVDLSGLDREGGGHVRLRVALRGWSMPRRKTDPSMPDHRAIVFLDNSRVGTAEWNGQQEAIVEAEVPAADVLGEAAWLSLRVPLRTVAVADGGAEPLIDIVVLNWMEVAYPRTPRVATRQARLVPEGGAGGAPLRLLTPADRSLVVYGDDGARLDAAAMRTKVRASGDALHLFRPPAAGEPFHAVPGGELARPRAVEPDFPSRLRDRSNRADYVMVTHRSLRRAVEPLADFHRDRGLAVEVVDVEDVYDEFNHGILHPRAIRDFLAFARDRWRGPAPRWVLLVGDASWDVRNPTVDERNYVSWTFRENLPQPFPITAGTPYEERARLNDRNLVPTWNYLTAQGHAASDNYFVTRPGSEERPEMAIGRFPVTEPGEVAAIVDKTIRYMRGAEVGPWRRRALWISDGDAQMGRFTDSVSRRAALRGLAAERIEPRPDEPTNEGHTRRLREALDRGQLIVHFLGHGGRFIWRTAPADLKKNRDLFGLEDLDLLEPNARLPVVLSMTCYSGPFDHPSSDSIGEKFLRLEDRGAVAVIAASWRNSPSRKVSDLLVEELLEAPTVGEALASAKRGTRHRYFIHLYNLLGDPALELAAPAGNLGLEVVDRGEGRVRASLTDAGPGGRAVVEWLGEEGEVLAGEERALEAGGEPVELAYRGPEGVALLRVYVWNEETGEDALGLLELGVAARAEAAEPRERPAAGSRR